MNTGGESTDEPLVSQEAASTVTSKVHFDFLRKTFLVTRDLGMMILAFAIMYFSHLDHSANFWIWMVILLILARLILFFASFMVGEPCNQGRCINTESVVTLFLIIIVIGLIVLSETVLGYHLPQFPKWFALVAIGYYIVFSVIFYVFVRSFLYVGGDAQGESHKKSDIQLDVENSAA